MYKYEPELSTNIEISRQNKKIIFSVLTKKRCVKNRSPEQLHLLHLLIQSGLKLSRAEFEVLKESIGNNYFGNRILSALAERDGIFVKKNYGLETYERILKDCISSADIFLKGFYGSSPAWELVPNNVNKHIVAAAAAGAPIKDGCALHRAALLWDGSSVPCSKTKISAEDKDILNKLYSGCLDESAKIERTKGLIAETPELKEGNCSAPSIQR